MDGMLDTPQGRRIAWRRREGSGQGPGVVFIHGFNSDMAGTKAEDLDLWAAREGRAFLRFDLSGHGASGGRVEDFGINDWLEDTLAVLDSLAEGPQVLVGSSLGGWLALLVARERPQAVSGLVTIAAAPDFTQRMQQGFTAADWEMLRREGHVTRPSDYGADYVFSQRLFDQGQRQTVFGAPLSLPMPARVLQGTADADVPMAEAMRILAHAEGPDIRAVLVKDADHRFSTPACLALIRAAVAEVG